MKLLLLKLLLTVAPLMAAKRCSRPILNREPVFIYRTMRNVYVEVHRCLYNDSRNSYSDISDHCLSALKTQSFFDKFGRTNNLKSGNSKIVLENYKAIADPLKNLIYLRSGTTCRYDRGFCYDPSETVTYAAVWNVIPVPTEKCPSELEQVFYGYVDFWTFAQEKLKYIFYYDDNSDSSFFLRQATPSKCRNKQVWYTDENNYIISLDSLAKYDRPTKKGYLSYFPLKSKRLISEAILKDCDLRSYSTDFNQHITADHLVDRENLKIILNLFQDQIQNNSKSIDQFTIKFNNIKRYLEIKNNEINRMKGFIDLYKSLFQKLNATLNSLIQDRNGSKEADVSCGNDLSGRINKFNISITKLENGFKTLSTSNDDNKKNFKNDLSNLGGEVDKKFNNFSVSFENQIEKLNKTLFQTKTNIIIELEPLILSRLNDSSNCNEKVNSLQRDLEKKLNDFIKESLIKINALENKMIEYSHNIERDILSKTTAFSYKLSDLNEKIEELENNEITYKNLIEDEMKTYYDNITSIIDSSKILLQNDIQAKYISLTEFIDAAKEKITKDILLLKHNIARDNDNLKTEINKAMSTKFDDFNNNLKTVNNSLSKRLDLLNTDILDIMEKLKEFRTDMKTNKEENDLKIIHLNENVDKSIKLVTEAPAEIERNILNKLNSTLNSLINQSNPIKEDIENLKKGTDEKVKNLKDEIIKVCELGDKTVYQNITKMNNDISDDIKMKMTNLENQLRQNKNLTESNYKSIENKLEEEEKHVNNLLDQINNDFSNRDKNIAKKYNSMLAILDDRTVECKKEIQGLQNGTNKSLENLQNMYRNFTVINNGFIKELDKVNKSLINEINISGSKIKELEDKVKELMSATRNKDNLTETAIRDIWDNLSATNKNMNNLLPNLEGEIMSKIDPVFNSLNNQFFKCDKEVENLKNNFDKTIYDFKNQIFNNFSDSAEKLKDNYKLFSQKIDALNKSISNLENLERSQNKTQRNIDVKINYLLNQTESTWKELNDNIKKVDNVKNIANNIETKVNGLDSNNSFIMSYLTKVNRTADKNGQTLKQLQNELNLVNYSNSQSADFIKKQINQITAGMQKGSNDLKETQNENDKKFDDLTNDLLTSQQLLKNYEKEIEMLKQNLSSSSKLLSESIQFTKSLQNQIDNIKLDNEKKEIHLGYTILQMNNLIEKNGNKTLELKEELLNLRFCCNDHHRKLEEKDKEIQDMKDEFRTEIKIIKEEQEKLKRPVEVDPS